MIKKINKRNMHSHAVKETKDLGSHLKRRRLELKQNQETVARGICSVSYLSKLENNNIKFNHMIVQELMERLSLDPSDYEISVHDKQYLESMIDAYYQFDDKALKRLYNEVREIDHNLTVNIMKLIYAVDRKNDEQSTLVSTLEHVISSMSDLDLQAFLFFAGVSYQQKSALPLAYEMFELTLSVQQASSQLRALASDHLFEVKQMLHKKNSSFNNYLEAKRLYVKHNNIARLMYLQFKEAKFVFKEQPEEASKILSTLTPSVLDEAHLAEYHLLYAKVCYALQKEEDAKTHLSQITLSMPLYLEKLFLQYQYAEDTSKKNKLAEDINQHATQKKDLGVMISFRLFREQNVLKKKTYLKDIAIPYAKKVYNFDLLKELVKEMTEICMSTSRYKEATSYIQSYLKEKERIDQYIETVSLD